MERTPEHGNVFFLKLLQCFGCLVHSFDKGFVFRGALGKRFVPVGDRGVHALAPASREIRTAVPADGHDTASVIPFLCPSVHAVEVIVHVVQAADGGIFSGVVVNVVEFVLFAAHPG